MCAKFCTSLCEIESCRHFFQSVGLIWTAYLIINIAHGRDQHVYYDIVTTKATRSGINMLEERSRQIRNAHIRIDVLNKRVWLTIPLVLNYNNQQQLILIILNTHVACPGYDVKLHPAAVAGSDR